MKRIARMEDLREYEAWARTVQKRISRELAELKEMPDRKGLSELHVLATSSFVGIGEMISADEDIESIESETSEELAAERAMWEALNELAAVADAVEAELHQLDDSKGVDTKASTTRRKVEERWFGNRKAS